MTRQNNHFQIGSGCYTCANCGKKTRETGSGESGVNLCVRCFDMAGDENAIADGEMTVAEFVETWGEQPDGWCIPEDETADEVHAIEIIADAEIAIDGTIYTINESLAVAATLGAATLAEVRDAVREIQDARPVQEYDIDEQYGATLKCKTYFDEHGVEWVRLMMEGESGLHSIQYPRERGAILTARGQAHWKGFIEGHLRCALAALLHDK